MIDGLIRLLRRGLAPLVPRSLKPGLRRLLRNGRYRAHTHVGRVPALFFGIHGLLGDYRDRIVTPATEIVIEGAPRVASSYAVTAFLWAQERPVAIATHTHLAANVLRAPDLGLPALVIIREPGAALRSALLRDGDLTLTAAAERYHHFYRPLLARLEDLVVADFAEVTSDLGAVIGRINSRFGTAFAPYHHSAENEAAVREILRQRDELLGLNAVESYYPSAQKAVAKRLMDLDRAHPMFQKCERIYSKMSQRT